jgi:hypothetical protein
VLSLAAGGAERQRADRPLYSEAVRRMLSVGLQVDNGNSGLGRNLCVGIEFSVR